MGRREARACRRDAPRRPPGSRFERQFLRREPLSRQLGRARGRLRRHAWTDVRRPAGGADDPERPVAGKDILSVDRLPGTLGLRPAFFNGPTGPNLKEQWTEPIRWSEGWRDRSYTVPGGTLFGPGATGFFCGAVGGGSKALVRLVNHTLEFGLLVAGLLLIALLLLGRVTWRPTAPLRLARQRAWGQILTASWRMYGQRLLLFVGIGLVLVPISLLTTLVQTGILHATNILGVQTGGESRGFLASMGLAIGTALTLFVLGLVLAATDCALVESDAGRWVGALRAYALAADSAVPLLGALVIAAGVISLLASSIFLIPLAVLLARRWALIAPAIELARASAFGALRRSGRLVGRT